MISRKEILLLVVTRYLVRIELSQSCFHVHFFILYHVCSWSALSKFIISPWLLVSQILQSCCNLGQWRDMILLSDKLIAFKYLLELVFILPFILDLWRFVTFIN